MNDKTIQLCTPISNNHRNAMRWFSSLAQSVDPTPSLRYSIEEYSLFASTGNQQHLSRCEEFLSMALTGL